MRLDDNVALLGHVSVQEHSKLRLLLHYCNRSEQEKGSHIRRCDTLATERCNTTGFLMSRSLASRSGFFLLMRKHTVIVHSNHRSCSTAGTCTGKGNKAGGREGGREIQSLLQDYSTRGLFSKIAIRRTSYTASKYVESLLFCSQ